MSQCDCGAPDCARCFPGSYREERFINRHEDQIWEQVDADRLEWIGEHGTQDGWNEDKAYQKIVEKMLSEADMSEC